MSMSSIPCFLPAQLVRSTTACLLGSPVVRGRNQPASQLSLEERKHYSHSFPFVKFSLIAFLHQGTSNDDDNSRSSSSKERTSSDKQATIKSNVRQSMGNWLYVQPVSYYKSSHQCSFLLFDACTCPEFGSFASCQFGCVISDCLLSQTLTEKKADPG